MEKKRILLAVLHLSTVFAAAVTPPSDWSTLQKHPVPEWFADSKFGIYAHLGVYCVPAFDNEWYPRNMYDPKHIVNKHHVETYGPLSEFGYKDFIPMFTLANFDAEEWAELYKQAGAKFAGPVAEHHDGFSMWASKVNRWNAKELGPRRDVVGELVGAIRKRDLKVITSFHHAFNLQDFIPAVEGTDSADPKYEDFYGKFKSPDAAYERWFIKLKEVIDAWQPDQIWFDFCLGKVPDKYKYRFAAYYYGKEKEWNKEVIITRKNEDLPEGVGVLDIERGRMKDGSDALWQTDDSTAYNSWCWVEGLKVKPAEELIHELIDIVSKNGILLLNICPQADGTICDEQKRLLLDIGQWLRVNGPAIYATRPWQVYGEGPTRMEKGGSFLATVHYTPQDIRYTQSKDGKTIYAICLGRPAGDITLRSLAVQQSDSGNVSLLGSSANVSFTVNPDQTLTLHTSKLAEDKFVCKHAYAFRLEGFTVCKATSAGAEIVILDAEKAVFDGTMMRLEERAGRKNIGFWDDPAESAHWLVRVPKAGTYHVRCGAAAAAGPSSILLKTEEVTLKIEIPASESWDNLVQTDAGVIEFSKAGVYHVSAAAADSFLWKPVNLWSIQLIEAN
jgi:alpha-L-fucosidase